MSLSRYGGIKALALRQSRTQTLTVTGDSAVIKLSLKRMTGLLD
jgi:hypothetical protein